MIEVGLFGASGYTGQVLAGLLEKHPGANLAFATSNKHAGRSLRSLFPTAPDITLVAPVQAPLEECDVVFLCLPHTAAAQVAVRALQAGLRVVDLSADFRLADSRIYERWYGTPHPAPELLAEAVYGLTEWCRGHLSQARLVANPGCYPTSVLTPLRPLLQANAVGGSIIVDSKSGVSGAGRAPKQHTHFVEVADNFSPYAVGQMHRHWPEMKQYLDGWRETVTELIFSPHLLPVPRGILSTIYVPLLSGVDEVKVRGLLKEAYGQEPFVSVLDPGQLATLAHANFTNKCVIGLTAANGTLIITSAIDNLLKGASGQAVQNMNVMFGLPEVAGLPC